MRLGIVLWLTALLCLGREVPVTVLYSHGLAGPSDHAAVPRSLALSRCVAQQQTTNRLILDCCGWDPSVDYLSAALVSDVLVSLPCDACLPLLGALSAPEPPYLAFLNTVAKPEDAIRFFSRGGLRIAVLAVAPSPAGLLLPEHRPDVEFEPVSAALDRAVRFLRSSDADLVILLYSGRHRYRDYSKGSINDISRSYPEIDLIIAPAGSGRPEAAMQLGDTLVAFGPENHLGRIDLVFDTVRRKVRSHAGSFIPIEGALPSHMNGATKHLLSDWVAVRNLPLVGLGDSLGEQLGRSMLTVSDSDIALFRMPSENQPAKTVGDAFDRLPVAAPLCSFLTEASRLRKMLEEAGEQVGMVGASLEKGRLLMPDGRPPHGRSLLQVVVDGRLLAPDFAPGPSWVRTARGARSRFTLCAIDTWQVVAETAAGNVNPQDKTKDSEDGQDSN